MSKINAIRFINVNYNNNNIRINDECLYFKGESTLISLENGGGKSVMIQMLMAPFVQKAYRDLLDRRFASYFQSSAPTFILVEWLLDANAGYVLTGMMVRKNQHVDEQNENELELFTFISEYTKQCERDIHHLPVIEMQDGRQVLRSFRDCRELFQRYGKDPSAPFDLFDMNIPSQSRNYFARLAHFGINNREWQSIIHTVNREEGGLSKIFAECKTERKLVEKWFLPQVETKLNGEGNIIRGLQGGLEEYITHLGETEASIAQKDAIVRFLQDSDTVLEKAGALQEAGRSAETSLNGVRNALASVKALLPALSSSGELLREELDACASEMARLICEQCSLLCHQREDALEASRERLARAKEEEEKHSLALRRQEEILLIHTGHLLCSARDRERSGVRSLMKEHELARCEAGNHNAELARLGGQLKSHLLGEIARMRELKAGVDREMTVLRDALRENKAGRERVEGRIREAMFRKGEVQGKLAAYEQMEDAYFSTYHVDFDNTLFQTKYAYPEELFKKHGDELDGHLAALGARLGEFARRRAEAMKEREQTVRRMEELQRELSRTELDRQKREEEWTRLAAEIESRRDMLKYLDLDEALLYDVQALRERNSLILSERGQAVASLKSRAAYVEKSITLLEKGFLDLPDEVRRFFADLDIPLTYGLAWLRSQDTDLARKKAMAAKNAFLPYALLLERRDLQKIRECGTRVETVSPIPLIPLDSLSLTPEESEEARQGASLPGAEPLLSLGEDGERARTFFYTTDYTELLDEEAFGARKGQLETTLAALREEILLRSDELQVYRKIRTRLDEQHLSEHDCLRCKKALVTLAARAESLNTAILEAKDRLKTLSREDEERERLRGEAAEEVHRLEIRRDAFSALFSAYAAYREEKKAMQGLLDFISREQEQQKKLCGDSEQWNREMRCLEGRASDLAGDEANLSRELAVSFQNFEELPLEDGFDRDLVLGEYDAVRQKLEKETGRSLSEIEEALKEATVRLERAEKELANFLRDASFSDAGWQERVITEADLEGARRERERLAGECAAFREEVSRLTSGVAVDEHRCREALSDLKKRCGRDVPLPRGELAERNFGYLLEQLGIRKNALEEKRAVLQGNMERLTALFENYGNYYVEEEPGSGEVLPACFSVPEMDIRAMESFMKVRLEEYAGTQAVCEKLRAELRESVFLIFNSGVYAPIRKILPRIDLILDDPEKILRELPVKRRIFEDMLKKLQKDISKIEDEKTILADLLFDYLEKVHWQLSLIDRNSSIMVRDRSKKTLRIDLPKWEEYSTVYHQKVILLIDAIRDACLDALHAGREIHDLVSTRLTTRELYDRVVGIGEIGIHLMKVESQRELMISWRDVTTNSGGEGFLSSFIVLSSLLSYMRHEEDDPFRAGRNEGKTLIMDNPFGKTNASHLLKPLMEVAKKNNLQLICLTGLGGDSIYDRFDNIYVLNLVPTADGSRSFVKSTCEKGSPLSVLSLSRLQVMEQSTFFGSDGDGPEYDPDTDAI
ncbi:MAG: hypothetical protein K5657_00175 [Desulfovibrio sp.]|nr:hypothetical protein [Desulfovibrio sp.]